jgi:hypothetical protein
MVSLMGTWYVFCEAVSTFWYTIDVTLTANFLSAFVQLFFPAYSCIHFCSYLLSNGKSRLTFIFISHKYTQILSQNLPLIYLLHTHTHTHTRARARQNVSNQLNRTVMQWSLLTSLWLMYYKLMQPWEFIAVLTWNCITSYRCRGELHER